MKLLFLLFITIIIGTIIYLYFAKRSGKVKKSKKLKLKTIGIASTVILIFLILIIFATYQSSNTKDTQCKISYLASNQTSKNLKTAMDYFQQGNLDYDSKNCVQANLNYTKSIQLNPAYPQAYNNRAYTNMRMHNYKEALADLDSAIKLNPNYVQALMNRGDIHNYYYQIDRQSAILDYQKVISLGQIKNTSVCGHLFLAKHKGWNLSTVYGLLSGEFLSCK